MSRNFQELIEERKGAGLVQKVSYEERKRMSELMCSIDWDDKVQRKALADVVVKKLEEEVMREDMTEFFADVDTFAPNETPEYQFQKGIKAYVREPGSFIPHSTIIQRVITITTERTGAHPEFEVSALRGGRYGSFARIKSMVKDEILGLRNKRLWNTLVNSIPSTTTDGNYVSVAKTAANDIKKNFVVSGLDYIDDKASVKAIVGRRSQLGWINDVSGYTSEALKGRIETAGGKILGDFRGVPVVALHQHTDGYDVGRISDDDIMIVAEGTTKRAQIDDMQVYEWVDGENGIWHVNMFMEEGNAIFWPNFNWRIALT
jgi:hypothetical protein